MKTNRQTWRGFRRRWRTSRAYPRRSKRGSRSERLPAQVIRELADIDLAARAVAAELTRHTPRLGYGSES